MHRICPCNQPRIPNFSSQDAGCNVHEEIEEFYRGPYQKPVLGSKEFIGWIRERLGAKARVEQEKPESRRVFGLELEEIVKATAKEYGKPLEELRRRRRGAENEARMVATYRLERHPRRSACERCRRPANDDPQRMVGFAECGPNRYA